MPSGDTSSHITLGLDLEDLGGQPASLIKTNVMVCDGDMMVCSVLGLVSIWSTVELYR